MLGAIARSARRHTSSPSSCTHASSSLTNSNGSSAHRTSLPNPTSAYRQGADVGPWYSPAVFYHSEAQRDAALATRGLLQDALSDAIEGFCGERVTVFGAGRTDTGVHARGQVAHIDLAQNHQADKVMAGINFHLKPYPVAVLEAGICADDFDARFSALARH